MAEQGLPPHVEEAFAEVEAADEVYTRDRLAEECEHPEDKRQPSVTYDESEATYCSACRSLVFADGHVERVQITGIRTYKR